MHRNTPAISQHKRAAERAGNLYPNDIAWRCHYLAVYELMNDEWIDTVGRVEFNLIWRNMYAAMADADSWSDTPDIADRYERDMRESFR